jgi:hypothetical protein
VGNIKYGIIMSKEHFYVFCWFSFLNMLSIIQGMNSVKFTVRLRVEVSYRSPLCDLLGRL